MIVPKLWTDAPDLFAGPAESSVVCSGWTTGRGDSVGGTSMPLTQKPREGSWTEHAPGLGTGPISYEDSISPESFERERRAIFARTWLNVGRLEQLPRAGSYVPTERQVARTSRVRVAGTGGG